MSAAVSISDPRRSAPQVAKAECPALDSDGTSRRDRRHGMQHDDDRRGAALVFSLGAGTRLSSHLEALSPRPAVVMLVDPVPVSAPALPQLPPLSWIEGVPGPETGKAELRRFSLPGLCGLAPATEALWRLYPGLTELAPLCVPMVEVAGLAPRIRDLPSPLAIIIDAPGLEAPLLSLLADHGALECATTLSLRCATEACFEGAVAAAGLCSRLESLLFDEIGRDDEDPDWPVIRFRHSPLRRQIAELETALGEITRSSAAEIAELEERVAALRTEAAILTERLARAEVLVRKRSRERDAARTAETRLRERLAVPDPLTSNREVPETPGQ